MKKSMKAIIFDLDGTLMNTKSGIIKALNELIENHQFEPIPKESQDLFVGPPMANSLITYYGFDKAFAKTCALEFREIYANKYSEDARTYNQMKYVLNALRAQGYTLCVATYKREDVALKLLNHYKLAKYFDVIHGSDQNASMTKADIIRKTMADAKSNVKNTIMVGDTRGDGEAAKEVGCAFIAVTYGYGFKPKDNIDDLNPIAICTKVLEIYSVCIKAHRKIRKNSEKVDIPAKKEELAE